jgi:hypothetical protein
MLVFFSSCQVRNDQNKISTPTKISFPTQATITSTSIFLKSTPSPMPTGIGVELFSFAVPKYSLYPVISPDGHWVALPGCTIVENENSTWATKYYVWIYDLSMPGNSQWIPLFSNREEVNGIASAKFSPDGKYLEIDTKTSIWFVETNNWQHYIRYDYTYSAGDSTWSPDSKGIAAPIHKNGYILYYLKTDGSLTPLLSEKDVFPDGIPDKKILSVYLWGPTWSPDGGKIAYIKFTEDQRELWILDIKTKKKERVINKDIGMKPVWSPDGTKIATYAGYINIYDLQTKTVTSLFADLYDPISGNIEPDFVWSPDGKQIAIQLIMSGFEKDQKLYLVNIDTGDKQLLTYGVNNPYAWTKNNDILSYDMADRIIKIWHYDDN